MNFTIDFKSRSPVLPEIQIPCFRGILDPASAKELREFVVAEEPNILANTPLPEHESDPEWLTGRLWHYNLLDYDRPEIRKLEEWVAKQYVEYITGMGHKPEPVYIQMWANVCRPGGRLITKHNHAGSHIGAPPENAYISGTIFLGECLDTKTYFQNPFLEKRAVGIPNILGHMIMFPSYVNHWIDGTRGSLLRVSLAFDLITQDVYNFISQDNFRPLNW